MEPILGSAAVRRGELTRHQLGRDYARIYRDVYVPRDLSVTALIRARAAWTNWVWPEAFL